MSLSVQLTRAAAADLDLAEVPIGSPPRVKPLKGFAFPLYRFRSGDFRVLYRIDESRVTIMRVINRRDLERTLRQLGR